jgi:hypothetical protein
MPRSFGDKLKRALPKLLLLAFLLGVIVPLMVRAACGESKKQITLDEAYGKDRPFGSDQEATQKDKAAQPKKP